MKTATAFLVAVTVFASVFLESSAAPNPHIGEIFLGIGAAVPELSKAIGKTIKKAGEVTDIVLVKAGGTLEGVAEVVVNKAAKDIETVEQFASKIFKGLEATFGKITQAATALGGEIGEKLNEALIKLPSNLNELIQLSEKTFEAVAEGAVDTVKELVGLIKIVVAKLKTDVAEVIDILDKISEKGGVDVALAISTIKGFLAKVVEAVEVITSKVAVAVKSKTTEVTGEALIEYVEEEIKTYEKALAAFKKIMEKILATATAEQKENIAKVVEWLKKFVPPVNEIHKELREAIKDNNLENLKKTIEKIEEATKNTKLQVTELIKTQDLAEMKEALENNFLEIIVGEAVKLVINLKKIFGIENNAV